MFSLLDVKRYLTQSFTKHGKFTFLGSDANLDVNRYLGQLILLVWELCDVYNLMKIPQDPFRPTHFVSWTLADFNVPTKVSLFQVLVFDFPLLCSASFLSFIFSLLNFWSWTMLDIHTTILLNWLLILALMMGKLVNLV